MIPYRRSLMFPDVAQDAQNALHAAERLLDGMEPSPQVAQAKALLQSYEGAPISVEAAVAIAAQAISTIAADLSTLNAMPSGNSSNDNGYSPGSASGDFGYSSASDYEATRDTAANESHFFTVANQKAWDSWVNTAPTVTIGSDEHNQPIEYSRQTVRESIQKSHMYFRLGEAHIGKAAATSMIVGDHLAHKYAGQNLGVGKKDTAALLARLQDKDQVAKDYAALHAKNDKEFEQNAKIAADTSAPLEQRKDAACKLSNTHFDFVLDELQLPKDNPGMQKLKIEKCKESSAVQTDLKNGVDSLYYNAPKDAVPQVTPSHAGKADFNGLRAATTDAVSITPKVGPINASAPKPSAAVLSPQPQYF